MEKLNQRLEEIYGDGKWIFAVLTAASAGNIHKMFHDWGSSTLVVAANEGTGDLPETGIVYTMATSDSAVGAIREFFKSVEDPNPGVIAAVDRFDPERRARVVTELYATAQEMVGRKTFGVRHPDWSAWEDKMRIDDLWEDLSIPHAEHRIVDVADAPTAASEIGNEMGSVWVADNSQGWHGGGDFVKWVHSFSDFESAVAWFSKRAERVRVMPFLDGLPCSIHGWVTANGVATFLPVEIFTLRDMPGHELFYSGVSTMWAAPPNLSDEMRAIARKVGRELGDRVGYRGPFGVDGVATVDGFRPTELNPRMSAGAGAQMGSVDVPLGALMRAEIEGFIEVDHKWLEDAALGQREPMIHFGRMANVEVRDSLFVGLDSGGDVRRVDTEKESVAKITAGPSATGSHIAGTFDTVKIGVGPPVGSLISAILNLVSNEWALGLPPLSAAPDLLS
ncbi:MAG TPA: hypothetical protein VIW94_02330 [Acidimicrobiia bacterium]